MKDFRKNKQAFKQVHLLAIIILTLFIHSFFHTSLLFSKSLRQLTMGQKKKKNTMRQGKAERKARGKYRMEPMIVNWSHHV